MDEDRDGVEAAGPRPWRRYCPLEQGETVEVDECLVCRYRPSPPFRICAPPRWALPRRRGFWDCERLPE